MSVDCPFCKIAARELPARIVREDDATVAFEDIHPQAPVHILVIPRAHTDSVLSAPPGAAEQLVQAAVAIARERNLEREGFRLVANTGAQAGQSVFHLHLHLLAGRPMRWPPG